MSERWGENKFLITSLIAKVFPIFNQDLGCFLGPAKLSRLIRFFVRLEGEDGKGETKYA